ncbi:mitotic spindle assembly checkpoint protein MAD1 isoform X2 [Zootermopsis nevadensis]|uniref:mitotic spindle assembly checkpoint protein MAD1 isoform X2 n=1 Tax=Zootermopsis nevadensis TaxID=136037 RepID=UPI000B8E2AC5|nr:mitotic spindle assembly checkpoint protein MAD1 isoform X2 [Zootermopsis nevadensis]
MFESQDTEDPTCVIKMLDEFRQCNPTVNRPNFIDMAVVPTILQFDDCVVSHDSKKRKHTDSNVSVDTAEDSNISVLASPWETRRMKAELAEAKALNASLEERIKKLHSVRMELELVFDNEKTSFLKQRERDREIIRMLEGQIATLRKREVESRDEFSQYRQSTESSKCKLEKKILRLQEEYTHLDDRFKQVELTHKKCAAGVRRISELEGELKLSNEEVASLKDHIKLLEEKVVDVSNLKYQLELVEHCCTQAQQKIKELKLEQDKGEETRELLEKQHHNLMRLPDLEREVASLRDENRNLRDAVRNKLVLEEEVVDLRSRQAGFELREQKLAQLDASQGHLESMLEHWRQLARDHCLGVPPEKAMAGPEFLRMRIETLQQKELQLTADLGDLGIRLKTAQQAKSKVEMELDKATKQIERLQVTNDDQSKLIKRLQKRLLLVSRERDSYRSQLDMYEKELTVTSSSALLNSQQQQQRSRVEALEKTVDGYRDLVMKLEADLEKAVKGGIQFSERIYKLEEERNTLQQEKEQLMKRRDELEVELEYRALKGDFNPMKSKVLHIRMNPAATVEAQREDKLTHLQQECNRLQERVRVLEGGQMQDVTQEVNLRLAASSTQEVQELQEQVKSYETKLQRLKEAFKTTSQEYREVCYMLLGYKIDRIKSSLYRLSSMYAESQDDYLLFKLADGNPELLETPYSATLEQFINLHLKHQHSIPVFLSAITIDLFGHQTE